MIVSQRKAITVRNEPVGIMNAMYRIVDGSENMSLMQTARISEISCSSFNCNS